MRKLASIQKVLELRPIDGADRIEVAQVLGWECVVKKGEFKVGENVIYIEVDSKLPPKPEFEFLAQRKYRVKTIKLRKQVSQGLVLPISNLPKGNYKIGDDVTDIMGIVKHDPQAEKEKRLMEQELAKANRFVKYMSKFGWFRKIFIKEKRAKFPTFISKTDETRIQNIPQVCNTNKYDKFIVTEKLDGQSGTYFLVKNERKGFAKFMKPKYTFGVCSRNLLLPNENDSSYWTIARKYNIQEVLESLIGDNKFVCIQGEILGEGIQSNRYKVDKYDFYAFNLLYPNRKITSVDAKTTLEEYGIKFVPILETEFKLKENVSEMVDYSKGKSVVTKNVTREGVVIRNYEKDLSFKVINPDWLLKNED